VAEERGQFGNSEEGKHPPLKAATRELVKGEQTENT
jgi:hypothetical protein